MRLSVTLLTVLLLAAPAQGASGWYLFIPPTLNNRVVRDVPIQQWRHFSSYDTAAQCEAFKEDRTNFYVRLINSRLKEIKQPNHIDEMFAVYMAARCIPAEEARWSLN